MSAYAAASQSPAISAGQWCAPSILAPHVGPRLHGLWPAQDGNVRAGARDSDPLDLRPNSAGPEPKPCRLPKYEPNRRYDGSDVQNGRSRPICDHLPKLRRRVRASLIGILLIDVGAMRLRMGVGAAQDCARK